MCLDRWSTLVLQLARWFTTTVVTVGPSQLVGAGVVTNCPVAIRW